MPTFRWPWLGLLASLLLTLSAAPITEADRSSAHIEEQHAEHGNRGHDIARRAHQLADATHTLLHVGREPLSTALNQEVIVSSKGDRQQETFSDLGHRQQERSSDLAERLRTTGGGYDHPGLSSGLQIGSAEGAAEASPALHTDSRKLQVSQELVRSTEAVAEGQSMGLLQRYEELEEVMDLTADDSIPGQRQASKEVHGTSFGSVRRNVQRGMSTPRLPGADGSNVMTGRTGVWIADGGLTARRAGTGKNKRWRRTYDEEKLEEEEEGEESSGWLGAWWPMKSQYQAPARPTAKRRKFGKGKEPRGRLAQLTSHFTGGNKQPIPKIIHQVYVEGKEALTEAEERATTNGERFLNYQRGWRESCNVYVEGEEALIEAEERATESGERFPKYRRGWRESCKLQHPEWEIKLWNLTMAEQLLEEQYSWFLPTFRAYPKLISKADAIRPFVLHAFGGLYLDVDTECFAPTDSLLEDHDIVLQLEDGGKKSLTNAVVAGVKGHPFWETWQHHLYNRAPALLRKKPFWWTTQQELHTVLNSTGPWLLRAVFRDFTADAGELRLSYSGAWRVNNTDVMIYPMGLWFVPCVWNNYACHERVEALALHRTLPPWLVGHHKNSGSWHSQMHGPWDDHLLWGFYLLAGAVVGLLVRRCWKGQTQAGVVAEHARLQSLRPPRSRNMSPHRNMSPQRYQNGSPKARRSRD